MRIFKNVTVVLLWKSGWLRPVASLTQPFARTCGAEFTDLGITLSEDLRLWLGDAAGLTPWKNNYNQSAIKSFPWVFYI